MFITSLPNYGRHLFGNSEGGKKAAESNRLRYGPDFYERIGKQGGRISRGGGFAKNPELARQAGQIGGQRSRGGGRPPKLHA